MSERVRTVFAVAAVVVALALLGAPPTPAQPFITWLHASGPTNGYIEIPNSPALNPTSAFTFEAWVRVTDALGGGCSSIAGKGYKTAWWVGLCGTKLRSYLRGNGGSGEFDNRNGGEIPPGQWTHIAVVFDGSHRIHYIDGEVALSVAETSPLTTNSSAVQIGSDVDWAHTPLGDIDEVRLWNVARTQAQIRDSINVALTATPGLVALWHLNGSSIDSSGHGHNGATHGSGLSDGEFGILGTCAASTATSLCLGHRFQLKSKFRVGAVGTAEGNAQVAVSNAGSGIFWFFDANTWEVMAKVLDGCGLNGHIWVFSAATTNVHYRLEVLDLTYGGQKIYFNYPGPPAPAVTDVSALGGCS